MLKKEPAYIAARLLKGRSESSRLSSNEIRQFWLEIDPFEDAEQYDITCTVESDIWLHDCDWIGIYASAESADAEFLDCQFVRSFWGLRKKSFKVEFQCQDRDLIEGLRQCEARYFSWNGREYECIRRCSASRMSSRYIMRPVFGSVF